MFFRRPLQLWWSSAPFISAAEVVGRVKVHRTTVAMLVPHHCTCHLCLFCHRQDISRPHPCALLHRTCAVSGMGETCPITLYARRLTRSHDRRDLLDTLTLNRDKAQCWYSGSSMPGSGNPAFSSLHNRELKVTPTYLLYVGHTTSDLGLRRLGISRLGLYRTVLCRPVLSRSNPDHLFNPSLDPIRGSSPRH